MKGLIRSLSRGPAQKQVVRKHLVRVDQTFLITGATGVAQFATGVIGGLPEGNLLLLGAVGYVGFAGPGGSADLAEAWEGDYAVGTTATADTTLDGTDVDVLPSTALVAAAEVAPETRAANAVQAILDNTDGSLELNLNFQIDADEVANGQEVAIRATGVVEVLYSVLLDD
jgi:hypothetical protein